MIRATRICVVFLAALAAVPVSAQSPGRSAAGRLIAQLRRQVSIITRETASYNKVTADADSLGIERRSTDGTQVEAYCKGDSTRLMIVTDFGEHSSVQSRFYWWNDELFFAHIVTQRSDKLYVPPVASTEVKLYFKDAEIAPGSTIPPGPKSERAATFRRLQQDVVTEAESFFASLGGCPGGEPQP